MPNVDKKRGDTVRIRYTIQNTGDLIHTFWAGTSIISPSGFVTDLGEKSVSIVPGESRAVEFIEVLGPVTGFGVHKVVVALWPMAQPFTGTPLDKNSTWTITVKESVVNAEIISVDVF